MPDEYPPAHRPELPVEGAPEVDREPRTVAGRAAISALRPYLRRAIGRTITAIEAEAAEPYRRALADLDGVLDRLAALDPARDWDAPRGPSWSRQPGRRGDGSLLFGRPWSGRRSGARPDGSARHGDRAPPRRGPHPEGGGYHVGSARL